MRCCVIVPKSVRSLGCYKAITAEEGEKAIAAQLSPTEDKPGTAQSVAQRGGLDLLAFKCYANSGTYQAAVQKDVEEGICAAVIGTAGFFINGRVLSGALPLESVVRMIEEELARAR
jgi:protein-disulfide isomerase